MENYETMKIILSLLQQQHGQLKRLSSQRKEISYSVHEISTFIMYFLKNQLRMHDIKLFFKDSTHETSYICLQPFAMYYNFLLLNTKFSSQYLLRKDLIFGHVVGTWPTLSPYLFVQIIWYSKCEDLLIESIMHVPLDLCAEILETTIKHINELAIPRAKRIIFLLIYKIYNKFLWLHLGTLSEQNVTTCVHQIIMYFEILLNLLVSPKFVTSCNLSSVEKHLQHGILVKNILYYIKKCMYSKIRSYSENHNLLNLFTLTYGNNEYMNYYHILPINAITCIIIRLDQILATLLLNQIKDIDSSEYIVWRNIVDNENTMISLHRAIIMECHYLKEFMKENDFLMKNEQLFLCLKQLIGPIKSEESILTLQELCHDIAKGKSRGIKELIKRYKEWDLYTLDFIRQRVKFLSLDDFNVILEYLYYKLAHLHTKKEKYQVYVSVLKILMHLKEDDLHIVILEYMERHFDDNCLEYLYNEESFDTFLQNLFVEEFYNSRSIVDTISQRRRVLLIFILLNPRDVLNKLIFYEMNITSSNSILFQNNMIACFIQSYFCLRRDQYTVLTYILKNIVLQKNVALRINFWIFINKILDCQMMTADDVMNELCIPWLINSHLNNIHIVLSHIRSILQKRLCTNRTNYTLLTVALMKKVSLLRRSNATFSKFTIYNWMILINTMLNYLNIPSILTNNQYNLICFTCNYIEPLDMKIMQPKMNILNIIQEYAKRCFPVYQLLHKDPQCHPKLRSYAQSFSLDQEAFIRHVMLHSFECEYVKFACELTFEFWHEFGWTDEMIAYENIIRITADVSQIVLIHLDTFPKCTFIMLLYAIINYCKIVTENMTSDKFEAIQNILFRTLSSINDIVSKTCYCNMYNTWLKRIQNIKIPDMETEKYYDEIYKWTDSIFPYEIETITLIDNKCVCNETFYCKYHGFLIKRKIAAKYNAYMFIRECMKLQNNTKFQYYEQLIRNLFIL